MKEATAEFLIAIATATSLFNFGILVWVVSLLQKIAKEIRGESRWETRVEETRLRR